MDQFIVSARKYRPATFDTVVGQEAVTDTLKNAIRSNHLASGLPVHGSPGGGQDHLRAHPGPHHQLREPQP
jgi:DNA polymerase-3 subunit gamma/tau